MKATTNVRWQRTPIRNEGSWIPNSIEDFEEVRRRLTAAGHPTTVVNGITGWLAAKAIGEHDSSSGTTRARYRKILAELGPGPYPDNDPRRDHDADDGESPIMHVM